MTLQAPRLAVPTMRLKHRRDKRDRLDRLLERRRQSRAGNSISTKSLLNASHGNSSSTTDFHDEARSSIVGMLERREQRGPNNELNATASHYDASKTKQPITELTEPWNHMHSDDRVPHVESISDSGDSDSFLSPDAALKSKQAVKVLDFLWERMEREKMNANMGVMYSANVVQDNHDQSIGKRRTRRTTNRVSFAPDDMLVQTRVFELMSDADDTFSEGSYMYDEDASQDTGDFYDDYEDLNRLTRRGKKSDMRSGKKDKRRRKKTVNIEESTYREGQAFPPIFELLTHELNEVSNDFKTLSVDFSEVAGSLSTTILGGQQKKSSKGHAPKDVVSDLLLL